VQDFEDSESLYTEVAAAAAAQPETKEISFAHQQDRDQAVAKLQEVFRWETKVEQVRLGQAIAFPSSSIAILIFVILIYWVLACFFEGKSLGFETWSWLLLDIPINVLGIKYTSIILGCGAFIFLILLVKRVVRHPLQLILLPINRKQSVDSTHSDHNQTVPGGEWIPERIDQDAPKGTGEGIAAYHAEPGAAADRPRE